MPILNDVASNETLGAGPVSASRGCERIGRKHRVAGTDATTIASRISVEAQNGF
jgi:hypothetical protein